MSNLTHYLCPVCKSKFMKLSSEKAIICPYCENEAAPYTPESDEGLSDFIIPFKIAKGDAAGQFKKIISEIPFLPEEFENFDAESEIKGLYIPFWLFDGQCNAKLIYHAQKIFKRKTFFYRIPYSFYNSFSLKREGTFDFENIPVDASFVADNAYTEAIEPYDYSELVPFSEEYLKDFIAEKANVSKSEAETRANERLCNTLENNIAKRETEYENVSRDFSEYGLYNKFSDCNLLPVWLLNFSYKGKLYRYAVNGQTGKIVGEIPACNKKRNIYFLKALGISFAITSLISVLSMLLLHIFKININSPELLLFFTTIGISFIAAFTATNLKLRVKKAPVGNDLASDYVDKTGYKLIKKHDRFICTEVKTVPSYKTHGRLISRLSGWHNYTYKDNSKRGK